MICLSLYSSVGCSKDIVVPDIISIGECERGVVTDTNIMDVKKIWSKAERTDVLITGGCYQETFIKKRLE